MIQPTLLLKRTCLAVVLGLGAVSFVGCGETATDTEQVEIDPAEIEAQQDAMRANMEKAYSKGGGAQP